MQRLKLLVLISFGVLLVSLSACAGYKPARVLTPNIFGMTCPTPHICVEDPDTLAEATRLRTEAVKFIEQNLGDFQNAPRVSFCKTERCSRSFGMQHTKGYNFGKRGALIHWTGWQDYIVRHELIHHLQNERFGVAQASYLLPRWYIEGMAYSLSQDPRTPLPGPEIEEYRVRYEAWIAAGNVWDQPPKGRAR